MLDIGWSELFLLGVIALLVIGPKDLPRALYTVGKWAKAARKVTREFQKHVDDMMRETELEEVRKGIQKAQSLNVKKQIENAIDPKGELKVSLDPDQKPNPVAKSKSPESSGDSKAQPRSGITAGTGAAAEPRIEPVEAKPAAAETATASDKPA